jgi:heptosyltransferase-2
MRGLIIQTGAIGDCLLTLPLARFLKKGLDLGAVDVLGHTEYLSLFPGRTCVDSIRSMESMDLHRLFVEPGRFDLDLADHDPLIVAFAEYTWIVTFLGEPDGSFEKNLIYVVHCSHSAEVMSLRINPPVGLQWHLTEFHIRQFLDQCPMPLQAPPPWQTSVLIEPTDADKTRADRILKASGVEASRPLVVMHPGSGGPTKCWHVDNFLALARELESRGIQAVFLLGPAEQERWDGNTKRRIGQHVKVLPLLSLEEVLAVLSRADAFVGNDSGISHMAGGLGRKTVVVFGPTDPAVYRPIGPQVTVFRDPTDGFTQRPSVDLQQEILAHLAR